MKREKLEIIYSVAIIIAIPLILIANTIFLVRSVRGAYNSELRDKADIINSVAATMLRQNLVSNNKTDMASILTNLENIQPQITQLQILQQKDGEAVNVAKSSTAPVAIDGSTNMQVRVAYERNVAIAKLVTINQVGKAVQAWNVVTPITDNQQGKVIGVVSSSVLTTKAQKVVDDAFKKSIVFLLVSIIVIVVLLFRHFRLVGYIQLLAKQRELNQTMTDFLSVATHELKAPTSIMKGYIANVIDGTAGPINDEAKEQLGVALSQVERLNNLVQDLLNVSRVEQGRIEYKLEPVDTTAIINLICHTYQPIATAKNLSLSFSPQTDIPAIKSDAGRVQEVFTNLIDNAIKYTPSGSVVVTQKLDGNFVITSIKDTGLGMSNDDQKRLFQRFYRVKNDKTKEISGTGLGLWIIKQYIHAMGGSIELQSTEGEGSEFLVSFPINK